MGMRSGSVRLALCAMLIGTASAWALAPHDKAVGVQAERHAENGIQAQQNTPSEPQKAAETIPVVPSVHAPGGDGKGQPKAQESAEEGTEFWPPLYGYRFKITDSIVAGFTALLFFATFALWWATRRLVRGADKTAERQLRAYIGIDTIDISHRREKIYIQYSVMNFGQTPNNQATYKISGILNEGLGDIEFGVDMQGNNVAVPHWPGEKKAISEYTRPVITYGDVRPWFVMRVRIEIEYVDAFFKRRRTMCVVDFASEQPEAVDVSMLEAT